MILKQLWARWSKSSFLKSVAVLSSGQTVAAAIPILAAPILGRLYLPTQYGFLGVFMAISGVLGTVGNWQYAQAIIVEPRDRNAQVLVRVCVWASLITSAIALLIALAVVTVLSDSLEFNAAHPWLLLLPVSTFLMGCSDALSAMANRKKQYRLMAVARVSSTIVTVATSIGIGISTGETYGLFIALFAGYLVNFGVLLRGYFLWSDRPESVPLKRALAMFRKHRRFATYTTPAAFVGNFTMQVPIYCLGAMGAMQSVGLFNRGRQLLSMPISLLGGSIAQVFQQKTSVQYRENGNCRQIFKKTLVGLLLAGVLPTITLLVLGPWLFAWFLGPNWSGAGEIARILAPMLLLRLVCSPLTTVFYIVGAQREDLFLTIATSLLTGFLVWLPYFLGLSSLWVIVGFAVGYSVAYITYILRAYHHAGKGYVPEIA